MKRLLFIPLMLSFCFGQDWNLDILNIPKPIKFTTLTFCNLESGQEIEIDSVIIAEMTDSEFADFAVLYIICRNSVFNDTINVSIFGRNLNILSGDYLDNLCRKFLPERILNKENK